MPELPQRFEELVRLLVDQPEAVALEALPGRRDTLLELRVAPDDLGKVIVRLARLSFPTAADRARKSAKSPATPADTRPHLPAALAA